MTTPPNLIAVDHPHGMTSVSTDDGHTATFDTAGEFVKAIMGLPADDLDALVEQLAPYRDSMRRGTYLRITVDAVG